MTRGRISLTILANGLLSVAHNLAAQLFTPFRHTCGTSAMPQSESVPPPSLCRVERRDGALSSRCAELRISYPTSRFQRSDGARPAPRLREPSADPACPRADPSGPASRIQRAQQHNLARIQHGSSSAKRATDGPRMGSDRNGNTGRKAQDQAKTGGRMRKRRRLVFGRWRGSARHRTADSLRSFVLQCITPT